MGGSSAMGEGLQWFFSTIADLPGEGLQWGEGLQYNIGTSAIGWDWLPLVVAAWSENNAHVTRCLTLHAVFSI